MEKIKINPLAEIKSVKIQGEGYLLNGTMSVPKADGNREYELIKEWLKIGGNTPEPEYTQEELDAQALEQSNIKAKELRAATILEGADYNGFQISFTADDGNGLMQVRAAFDLGVEATNIHFENGTTMPITAGEFSAFAAWFVQKRNEFFV